MEIDGGGGRFRARVWADSIEQAVRLAGSRYPGCEARVLFPIEPETFFGKDEAPVELKVLVDAPEGVAG